MKKAIVAFALGGAVGAAVGAAVKNTVDSRKKRRKRRIHVDTDYICSKKDNCVLSWGIYKRV